LRKLTMDHIFNGTFSARTTQLNWVPEGKPLLPLQYDRSSIGTLLSFTLLLCLLYRYDTIYLPLLYFTIQGLRKITMDHIFNGTFSPQSTSLHWIPEGASSDYVLHYYTSFFPTLSGFFSWFSK